MKKIHLLSVLIFFPFLSTFGQINIVSNNYVGINQTSPSSQLDVNGSIQISNSTLPMGIMTENAGTATPFLDFDVNFREPNKNWINYIGACFRIDTKTYLQILYFNGIIAQLGYLKIMNMWNGC